MNWLKKNKVLVAGALSFLSGMVAGQYPGVAELLKRAAELVAGQ